MESPRLLSGWLWRGVGILVVLLLLAVFFYALVQVVTVLSSGVTV